MSELRSGYTTGSCAAAAAKAAARLLLCGQTAERVELTLPGGGTLSLPVAHCERGEGFACCAVRKDAGDDVDATDGMLIYARVERNTARGIAIDGGEGIGRVTLPGLDQPVGAAAINRVPREMIAQAVSGVPGADCGLLVRIEAPDGARIAGQTYNARLGIVGGISILGTTGIVEPMSNRALIETIRTELRVLRAQSGGVVGLTPGNYGERFALETLGVPAGRLAICSNFVGEALDMAGQLGFSGVLLVGHAGKLIKLAGGVFDTHSHIADCRMELFALGAALAGAPTQVMTSLLECVSADGALELLEQAGCREVATEWLLGRIGLQLSRRMGALPCAAAVFTERYGLLGMTQGAENLLAQMKEEAAK